MAVQRLVIIDTSINEVVNIVYEEPTYDPGAGFIAVPSETAEVGWLYDPMHDPILYEPPPPIPTVPQQLNYLSTVFNNKIGTGVTFGGKVIGAGPDNCAWVGAIYHQAVNEDPEAPRKIWLIGMDDTHTTDNAGVIDLYNQLTDLLQTAMYAYNIIYNRIEAEQYESYTEIEEDFGDEFDAVDVTRTPLPDIRGLIATLATTVAGKAAASHTHAVGDISGFNAAVGAIVSAAIDGLINGAPGTYDTLKEIADKLAADDGALAALTSALAGKVDKVTGYGLSKNDFTDLLKAKLDGLSTARTTSALTLNPVNPGTTTGGDTGVQIDANKASTVRVTYSTEITYSLTGQPRSTVQLKKCATNDANEANWTSCGRTEVRQPTGLTVTIGQVVGNIGQICADIPAGWYVKAVKTGVGTHTESFVEGEKTIHG